MMKMKKVMVTKAEMEAIKRQKDCKVTLNAVLIFLKNHKSNQEINKPISGMSVEQIVLAWHGYVEVEQEFVSFEEAYKARKEGKRVLFIIGNRRVIFMTNVKLEGCFLGSLTMDELFNGKFIVEGDNQ